MRKKYLPPPPPLPNEIRIVVAVESIADALVEYADLAAAKEARDQKMRIAVFKLMEKMAAKAGL